jgi:hypothetical protein
MNCNMILLRIIFKNNLNFIMRIVIKILIINKIMKKKKKLTNIVFNI